MIIEERKGFINLATASFSFTFGEIQLAMAGRKEKMQPFSGCGIAIAILVGIIIGCVCTVLLPNDFFKSGSLKVNLDLIIIYIFFFIFFLKLCGLELQSFVLN